MIAGAPGNAHAIFADGLVTVIEAATFLGLSRSQVYALMERGQLVYVKLGRSRRIPRRALIELASKNLKGGWNAGGLNGKGE